MVRIILVILALAWPIWKILEKKPNCYLNIYTYSSFTSSWSAGPMLNKAFIDKYKCNLNFKDVGDARSILKQIKMEAGIKDKIDADIVLGLDQYSVDEAKSIIEWENLEELKTNFQFFKDKKSFVAFDWAPLVFLTNLKNISSINNILNHKFALMDPRSSSPGYQFLVWALDTLGKDLLSEFKKKSEVISPSWTSAYSLFTKNETEVMFTYLTSLAYHWENNEKDYRFIEINKPYPFQVEFLAIPKSTTKKELAKKFVEFILSDESQKIVMQYNYMLPVTNEVIEGTVFEDLPKVKLVDIQLGEHNAKGYIEAWKGI